MEEFNQLLLKTNSETVMLHFIKKIYFMALHIFQGREHGYFEFRNRKVDNFDIGIHEVLLLDMIFVV